MPRIRRTTSLSISTRKARAICLRWIQNAGGKSRNSTITRWSEEYIRTGCEVDTDRQRTLLTLIVHLSDPPRAKLRFMQFGDSYTCSYCLQVIKWDHHRARPTKNHFFPKSKKKLLMGAKTTFICCQPCNSRKSDKVFSSVEEVRELITSRKKTLGTNIDGN